MHSPLFAASVHPPQLIDSHKAVVRLSVHQVAGTWEYRRFFEQGKNTAERYYFWIITIWARCTSCIMAASLAAVKKELRKKIKHVLKDLPEAAAASQCTHPTHMPRYFGSC